MPEPSQDDLKTIAAEIAGMQKQLSDLKQGLNDIEKIPNKMRKLFQDQLIEIGEIKRILANNPELIEPIKGNNRLDIPRDW